MSNPHKRTITFLILFIGILIYFVRAIPQVTLSERAVVLGMGIDIEGGYTVTCEIVNPKKQGAENEGDDGYVLYSGHGETLSDAIDVIAHKTGLTISLSQCNVLILGDSVIDSNCLPPITFLVDNYQVPEQALLLVADGQAKSLLETKPLFTSISAMQISSAMHTFLDSAQVITSSIKDFYEVYLGHSRTSHLAYISASKVSKNDADDDGEFYEYDYSKCVVFLRDAYGKIFDENTTKSINLVNSRIKKYDESVRIDDIYYNLLLNKKKYSSSVTLNHGKIYYEGNLSLDMYLTEAGSSNGLMGNGDILDADLSRIEGELARVLNERLINTYNLAKGFNIDIYCIADKIYAKYPNEWENGLSEGYLDNMDIRMSVNISVDKQ